MKSVKRWRHYCDHCRRGSFTRPSMAKHEAGCTLNPGRVCGICAKVGGTQLPTPKLITALTMRGLDALRHETGGCPACILAAIRQATIGIDLSERWNLPDGHWRVQADKFDYKKEMANVWSEINAEVYENARDY